MVHYPTDVIAGILEGIIIGVVVWYALKLLIFSGEKLAPNFTEKCTEADLEPRVEKKINRKLKTNKVVAIIVLLVICF